MQLLQGLPEGGAWNFKIFQAEKIRGSHQLLKMQQKQFTVYLLCILPELAQNPTYFKQNLNSLQDLALFALLFSAGFGPSQ